MFLTSKILLAPTLFRRHFTCHFAVIHLSFFIFPCAAPSLFSASLLQSPPPPSALFTVWKMPKFPATTYYKMHSSRTWINVWLWQPRCILGRRDETWRGERGDRRKKRQLGEGVLSRCPCAASWCEVLNGGLCRITLVACCIIDITGSVTLHWPAAQLLQQTLVDMHPLYRRVSRVFNSLFPAQCCPTLISFCSYINLLFFFSWIWPPAAALLEHPGFSSQNDNHAGNCCSV